MHLKISYQCISTFQTWIKYVLKCLLICSDFFVIFLLFILYLGVNIFIFEIIYW